MKRLQTARIAIILTDVPDGRSIFAFTMAFSIIAAFLMGLVSSYAQLLIFGLVAGIALASFAVGVGFVSGWYSAQRQGFALGTDLPGCRGR